MAGRASFPYDRILTPIGFTWVPVARVELAHAGRTLELEMICDSGADITLIPLQAGLMLGMRRGRERVATLGGIAGGTPYHLQEVTLRMGSIRLRCRVAWAQRDDVPMLLGRMDVFDRLVVTLDGRRRRISFRSWA